MGKQLWLVKIVEGDAALDYLGHLTLSPIYENIFVEEKNIFPLVKTVIYLCYKLQPFS